MAFKKSSFCNKTVQRTANNCMNTNYDHSQLFSWHNTAFQECDLRLLATMEAQVDTLCLLIQPKEGQQQFKNKKQPELTENQTVWKSDNQGVKEDTFIQTSRRGGDRQPGRRGFEARLQPAARAEAGGPREVAAGREGGPSFACRPGGTT